MVSSIRILGDLIFREDHQQRFWNKVKCTPDGCWIWLYSKVKGKYNYGQFRIGGKGVLAHDFAYESIIGQIPDGLTLDHLCRNPPCVNPMHLEPVTLLENLSRGEHHNQNSFKTQCLKGHPFDSINTYVDKRGNRLCKECQRERTRIWGRNNPR